MDLPQLEPERIEDLPDIKLGQMLLFKSKNSSVEGPVFYIKENTNNYVKMLPKLQVEFKDIIISSSYSTPLILMVRINNNNNLIYGQWFNKYNNYDRELIKDILFQDKLNFCVIDNDNNCRIRFRCNNIYKMSIWEYFKIKESDRRWSKTMFESDIISIESTLLSKEQLFKLME